MELVPRPTATLARVAPWLRELARTGSGLLEAFGPGPRPLDARTREQVLVTVGDAAGSRLTVWIHQSWRDFLGGEPETEELAAVVEWARASSVEGQPLDPAGLTDRLPPDAIRVLRAVVAAAELSALAGNSAEDLWERLRGRRPADSLAVLGDAAVVLASVPFVAPLVAAAGAMRLATSVAPPLPDVRTPGADDENLAVHLLRELVPQVLANAVVRTVVLAWPGQVVIGVRAGVTEATVRLSRELIEIVEGVGDDASLVLDGLAELLSTVGARRLGRDLSELDPRHPG